MTRCREYFQELLDDGRSVEENIEEEGVIKEINVDEVSMKNCTNMVIENGKAHGYDKIKTKIWVGKKSKYYWKYIIEYAEVKKFCKIGKQCLQYQLSRKVTRRTAKIVEG